MTHKIDTWAGCYPSNWAGVIVPEAMAHPAKYSIRLIYDHLAGEVGGVAPANKQIVPFCDLKRKESKSFFRRLAESKGSPRIDYEVVYCMGKPAHYFAELDTFQMEAVA